MVQPRARQAGHALLKAMSPPLLELDKTGWLLPQNSVQLAPSPNYDLRPVGLRPYLLVIHGISLPPNQFHGDAVVQFFQNQLDFNEHTWFENIRGVKVSAHFFIRRDGYLVQFISTANRAWHAGISTFHGVEGCNDFSIGVELEGADYTPYTEAQYSRLAELTRVLNQHYPLRAVRGHEHIAPGRKTDPGPAFNWSHYARKTALALDLFPRV